jgi:hypothetical protein
MTRNVAVASATLFLLAGCGTAALKPALQATRDPSQLTYTRLFCSQDNESHFETVTADLGKIDAAPPAPPFFARINPASRIVFTGFEAGWGKQDLSSRKFHPAPNAQFVIYLQGTMAITVTDGETRQFGPGDVLRVEDTPPCKGHISVVGETPSFAATSR